MKKRACKRRLEILYGLTDKHIDHAAQGLTRFHAGTDGFLIGFDLQVCAGSEPGNLQCPFELLGTVQGLGIGTVLLKHLTAIARKTGIEAFEAEVLPQNTGMMRVFQKSGLRTTERQEGGVVHVTLHL